jgi:Flp pilus assembly protein TadD
MTLEEAFNSAVQRQLAGDISAAEAIYRQILLQQPAQLQTRLNLGAILHDSGRFAEAIVVYRMGLAFDPSSAEMWTNLGHSLNSLGEPDQAVAACREALALNPNLASAHNNLGNALKTLRRIPEAKTHFEQAIALQPDFDFAHNNLGTVLYMEGDLAGSAASLRRALELTPAYPDALTNLGNVLADLGQRRQGIDLCRRSIEARPDFALAHWNLALMLLRTADFATGWAEYEWRWKVKDLILPRWEFPQPQWNGQDLSGRRILLNGEQGFGDVIQFVRYAPLVAARGGKVTVFCLPELARLMRTTPGVEQVVPWDQPVPKFDVHCPMLTLPLIFQTDLTNIPATIPYLSADPAQKAAWQARLKSHTGSKVGLIWAGRPTHVADMHRTIPLDNFLPLFKAPGVRFFSLQKGPAARQAARLELPLIDWTSELHDFAVTAALIANLDLVISADTAVAHLAGALGKPVWLLLPFTPDWRWMLDRADSPWYPTMRLFRQRDRGDWPSVFAEVLKALRSL